MRVVALVALWFSASTVVVLPQAPARPPAQPLIGTGAISGVVTDGQTKQPVAGALVQLDDAAARPPLPATRPRQMSDGSGRFVFQQLAAGNYVVRVTAPGYLDVGFERVRDSAPAGQIALQDKQWFADANTVLWKPASISGTIRDERGEPIVDVPVRILTAIGIAGRDLWASGAVTKTDDRGAYRFAGLLSGRYLVQVPSMQVTLPEGAVVLGFSDEQHPHPLPAIRAANGTATMAGYFAVPPTGHGQVYPATFYPSARSLLTADMIAVESGSEHRAVDVSLLPVSSVHVSGIVVGPAAAIASLPVRLLPAGNESLGFGSETAVTKTDSTGRFTLAQVPQGDYTLVVGRAINELDSSGTNFLPQGLAPDSANPFGGGGGGHWKSLGGPDGTYLSVTDVGRDGVTGRVSVSVGTEAIDGLVVPTRPGVTISGHALFDGADAPAAGHAPLKFGPEVDLEPADGDITRSASSSFMGFVPKVDAKGAGADSAGPTFSIPNVVPGHYRFTDGGTRDYRLVGAMWHGQDLFATPLDVTGEGPITDVIVYLSSKKNSVSGVVRASDSEKTAPGAVFIFPQDHERWKEPGLSAPQFRSVDVSVIGSFSTENLIPGDYLIAAVPLEDRRRILDMEFIKLLGPQAKRITIDESTTLTMDLHIVGVRR